jgi:hypothetical protein
VRDRSSRALLQYSLGALDNCWLIILTSFPPYILFYKRELSCFYIRLFFIADRRVELNRLPQISLFFSPCRFFFCQLLVRPALTSLFFVLLSLDRVSPELSPWLSFACLVYAQIQEYTHRHAQLRVFGSLLLPSPLLFSLLSACAHLRPLSFSLLLHLFATRPTAHPYPPVFRILLHLLFLLDCFFIAVRRIFRALFVWSRSPFLCSPPH